MKARIKATNEVAEILKAEQYASSGEYRFFWLDIDKPEPFNRFRPDEVELIDDVQYKSQYINKDELLTMIETRKLCTMDEHMKFYCQEAEKDYKLLCIVEEFVKTLKVKYTDGRFTQQDVNDLRLLSDLAFDGACMSDEDEKLIKRVSVLADKIEAMI